MYDRSIIDEIEAKERERELYGEGNLSEEDRELMYIFATECGDPEDEGWDDEEDPEYGEEWDEEEW